jgi:phosphoribosylformimino-5-aminoimidazole carboxamide ribotide isomerase
MRILPVIDLLGGKVVRGVAGDRANYAPIVSRIASDPWPASIARGFASLGFNECYVADLDAIAGRPPDVDSYAAIRSSGIGALWIDAGIRDERSMTQVLASPEYDSDRIVVGLESLQHRDHLKLLVERLGTNRLVFSLDLKSGCPLVAADAWRRRKPLEIARDAIDLGVSRIIVLDLANVGVAAGVSTEILCREIRQIDHRLEIIAGGGVRDFADIERLASWGCSAALVASALHDERIPAMQLQTYAARSMRPHETRRALIAP